MDSKAAAASGMIPPYTDHSARHFFLFLLGISRNALGKKISRLDLEG
jgi:hypothetical protein